MVTSPSFLSSSRSSRLASPRGLRGLVIGGIAIAGLVFGACSDDGAPSPDARGDAPLSRDSGAEASADQGGADRGGGEGIVADAIREDQGLVACTSGLDLAPLTLASAYCVGARVAAPEAAAFAFSPTELFTFEEGARARRFVVRRRALVSSGIALGAPSEVYAFTVVGTLDLFAGRYLAVAPTGGQVAVGYTLKDQSGAIELGTAGSAPTEVAAAGNYDALYLDADTLLVNGQGLGATAGGHAVYAYKGGKIQELISEIGTFSGFLALGEHVLFAGGFTKKNEIWAFSLAEVKAAISAGKTLTATADGDLIYAGPVTDAVALGDDLVFIDDDFVTFHAVRRLATTVAGDTVTAGATSDLVTPPAGTSDPVKVTALSSHGPWLGLRFTAAKTETLALVRAK